MAKLKYIIAIILVLLSAPKAFALDVQYGTIIGVKSPSFLVSYASIGKKQKYLCSVTTLSCATTTKTTLGTTPASLIKKATKDELAERGAGHLTLSPSGTYLAYYNAGDYATPTRTYTVRNIKTLQEYSVSSSVSYWDLINDESKVFEFSPDSKKLAYIDDKDGATGLYISDISKLTGTGIDNRKLSTTAYQVADFLFTDNSTIYYIGNTRANPYNWSLYRYNLKTNKDIALASNVSYVDPIKKIGSTVVFNELQALGYGPALYNITKGKVQRFTIPKINVKANVTNEEIIKTDTVKGVLMTPTKPASVGSAKSYKLMIWLHGGPYRETSYGYQPYHSYGMYDAILKLLRKNDVIVLKLDYPGSFGYGREYAESIKGSVGTTDVASVMNAISYAKTRFNINSVYLAGNSYGGYLSLKTLVEHPQDLTGVISINGVTDWQSLLEYIKTSIFNTHFNGLPNTSNQALYDQASIINKIGNINGQKIEIIQGQADRTIAPWQADLIYNKLTEQNKPSTIIRYPGEDHVFAKKSTLADLCTQMFTFVGTPVDPDCNK